LAFNTNFLVNSTKCVSGQVDIELPEDMLLREAHNIGETLQNKLEAFPKVERAYVHLDFECGHKPEHGGGSFSV